MSSVTIERAIISELPKEDFRESPDSEFSAILLFPDQPSPLISDSETPETWNHAAFHTLVGASQYGDVGAINQLAELSTREIQNGKLGKVLQSITAHYQDDEPTQNKVRDIVMRQYALVLNDTGKGTNTYDAVTRPAIEHQPFRPRTGIVFDTIDPMYPTDSIKE